jgi:hypothetical protein
LAVGHPIALIVLLGLMLSAWRSINPGFVGIIFDGNIYSLSGDFAYEDILNRATSVASPAIIESLNKVYDAAPLANELLNGKRK